MQTKTQQDGGGATAPDPAAAPVAADSDYPRPLAAWFMVGLLTLAAATSMIDRWIMTLVVEPAKLHFGVSDSEMGLLLGPAFAVVYIVMGIPFGLMSDRFNRTRLIAIAMVLWCAATVFCGIAWTFPLLALARFAVGVGESALSPCANSIVADSFPRSRQNRAIGVLGLGTYAGMGIAYLSGAAILTWTKDTPIVSFPILGEMASWQGIFVIVGLPGILLALIIACMKEPPRRHRMGVAKSQITFSNGVRYLLQRWRAYVPLCVGAGIAPLVGFSYTWLPTMFTRVWDWPVERFSLYYGLILIIMGPLGAILAGRLAEQIYKSKRYDGPYIVLMVGLTLLVIIASCIPLAPGPIWALGMLIFSALLGSLSTTAGIASIVFSTPGEYRGQSLAIYTVINATIGVFLGPTIVGVLNDHVFTETDGIRYSMATVIAVVGTILVCVLMTGRKAYASAAAELEKA